MGEGAAIALRFGVYLDLMLMFGLVAYPLYSAALVPSAANRGRLGFVALAVLGLVLSTAGFVLMTAMMAGVPIAELDRETLGFVIQETGHGASFVVRTVALVIVTALALSRVPARRSWLIAAASGVALGSLAWTGHAAATEGWPGALHRVADVVHLLAAGAWVGALAILFTALATTGTEQTVEQARDALTTFAVAGSVIVGLIVVTGIVNSLMIVGIAGLLPLPYTLYGQLLIAKLGLFALMLALASLNRWRLTPRVGSESDGNSTSRAVTAVRTSIALETAAAVAILALVAWFGTLEPPSPL